MAEIFSITGKAPPTSSDPLVELLEELLRDVRAGKISCLSVGYVTSTGYISTVMATGGLPHAHQLTAAALYALRKCEQNAGCV